MRRSRLITTSVFLFACAVLFYRLGSSPLHSWDEAIYAESAREMVQGGDWLTPHWNQQIFLQKPPLFIWATALCFKLFGVSETSARAISALAGVGCVVVLLFIVRLFASELTALFAALILLSTWSFNLNARTGMTDVTLTFFMLLAIYAYLRVGQDSRWWWLVGVGSGLAIMTKDAGAIPLFLSLAIVILWRDRSALKSRDLWLGAGACLLVGGTWHVIMLVFHGRAFLDDYFTSQVMNRTLQLMDSPEGQHGIFYYPSILLLGFFPGFFLLPFSLPKWIKEKRLLLVLPVFAVAVLALYTLASTKHQWYMIPSFPILSIVAAPLSKRLMPLYIAAIVGGLIFAASNQPTKETLDVAALSKTASTQPGPLGYYPAFKYAPEVLFYSNRPLCADAPDHSLGHLAQCPGPSYAIILADSVLPPGSEEIARSGEFIYCRIPGISFDR